MLNCWHSHEEAGKIFWRYVLMDSWVKTDKSRNKVAQNVLFHTVESSHRVCHVCGSLLSEKLHQDPDIHHPVTSMRLNKNGLMSVSFEGWETETSIYFYLVLQAWVILRITSEAHKNIEFRALLSMILTYKV